MSSSRLIASAAALLLAAMALRATSPQKALEERLGPSPVVVEMFTSQGCSSCPPADANIGALTRNPHLQGRVIPLAFHVDYWNSVGWRDPFSSADWSRRQMFYVQALKLSSAYTPQAVVNGSSQFVGSSLDRLDASIVAASHGASIPVRLSATNGAATIQAVLPAGTRERIDVLLVVYENGVITHVKGGENDGKTLTDDAIVRSVTTVGSLGTGPFERTVGIPHDRTWKSGNLGIVALLQNHANLVIRGAAAAKL